MSKGVGEMVRSRSVQVKASAGTEGARRATGVPADGAAGEAGPLAPGQRWSVGRKRDVVLRLLRGESLAALSRCLPAGGLGDRGDLPACRGRPRGGTGAGRLAGGLRCGGAAMQATATGSSGGGSLDAAKRHIGELSMETLRGDCSRERAIGPRGAAPGPFAAMRRSRGCMR